MKNESRLQYSNRSKPNHLLICHPKEAPRCLYDPFVCKIVLYISNLVVCKNDTIFINDLVEREIELQTHEL